jgi:hypothetical protein
MAQTKRLQQRRTSESKVDISPLKKFAFEEIPENWPLKDILLAQNDEIEVSTFLARLPLFLQLNKASRSR